VNEPTGPHRRGRHSSADGGTGGVPASYWINGAGGGRDASFTPGHEFPAVESAGSASPGHEHVGYEFPRYEPSRYEPSTWDAAERATGGFRRGPGVLDRDAEETGPVVEPDWWAYSSSDHPDHPLSARHFDNAQGHPSGPLPPRPPGVWDRLHPRQDTPVDDAETVAQPLVPGPLLDSHRQADETYRPMGGFRPGQDDPEAPNQDQRDEDPRAWEDQTGGLDVIGANVDEQLTRRRRWGRSRRPADVPPPHGQHAADRSDEDLGAGPHGTGPHGTGTHEVDLHDEHLDAPQHHDEDIPVAPYDPRSARARRRRRPLAVLISLLVLGGLVVGIVLGGQKLITMLDPSSRDFTGQGTGTVQIRVQNGDTLSDIARTLVDAGVIASVGPFVDAAEKNPDATGIQPGVYGLRQQMSGRSALDLLLDPVGRLVSRVTLREGLTVQQTLTELAQDTGRPIEEVQAAAADPAALGLPPYANGALEGFLFPATYDFAPDDTPADMLRAMITRAQQALDQLQIPVEQRLTVLTKASIVQAEAGSVEDMGKVARVLENRLADGMPLQLDTTVNYANNKAGLTTTPEDRENPSPYNTYKHPGLPPGAISNPGEEALQAVLAPTPGDWRFFVVVDPHSGETRFAVTAEEHQQNVLLFRQWLRENPGG
jgi:uncharacterized YceG family protein